MRRKPLISNKQLGLAIAALGALQQANAAFDTANLTALATIASSCNIDDATMDFGSNPLFSGTVLNTLSASVGMPVLCTNGTTATFGTASTITLTSGADNLTANLYTDSGHATALSSAATYVGTGSAASVSLYGQIIPAVSTHAGTYSGVVTLTLTY